MSVGQAATVEVAAGTGLELLIGLSAASRGPRGDLEPTLADALDTVGDSEGETWLNLLGVALEAGPPHGSQQLLDALRTIEGVELRRHLLGRFAWSWCTLAGIDDIESAAAGNRSASRRLLEHPRYYGGHATASLGTLLPLDAEETRARLVRAVEAAHGLAGSRQDQLAAAAAAADAALSELPPLTAIEHLTGGYRYVPEVEAERVVLIPHPEPALPLVLAQHRSARLIAYLAEPDRGAQEQLAVLGKALSDPKRVEILALVGRGVGRAGDLVEACGLTRSTVHHHLGLLRAAGLVALEGNARAYTYVPRRDAPTEVAELVASLVGTEEQ
ncbi:MAG TPA: ArsR family transcriptional regulator [Gaiellaceae bacterium]|nr:ArsR family transcriptional regulator [Gaiellaceae bacterium]